MTGSEDVEVSFLLDEARISEEPKEVETWPGESEQAHPSVAEQAAGALRPFLVRTGPAEQERMASSLRSLVDLRRSPLGPETRWLAIRKELKEMTVLLPIVGAMGEVVKGHVWDDRSWGFRLAGGAATVTAAIVGGKKAGLAMLGTAVAVRLWVVFGAGAGFAGLIIDKRARIGPQGLRELPNARRPAYPPSAVRDPAARSGRTLEQGHRASVSIDE